MQNDESDSMESLALSNTKSRKRKLSNTIVSVVIDLLLKIENDVLGFLQSCINVSVSMRKGTIECGIVFLSRLYGDECPFIKIIIGNAKKRRDVTVVSVTSRYEGTAAILRMLCSCGNGEESEKCMHRYVLMHHYHICFKLLSITSRKINLARSVIANDKYTVLNVPSIAGDDYRTFHTYKRWRFDLVNTTNSSLTLDCRTRRIRQGLNFRLD